MDLLLQRRLDKFDHEVELNDPSDVTSDDDNLEYYELLALFNSTLLLKLAAILRSCVTMYFHTTFNSIDCDGHAQFLQHVLLFRISSAG